MLQVAEDLGKWVSFGEDSRASYQGVTVCLVSAVWLSSVCRTYANHLAMSLFLRHPQHSRQHYGRHQQPVHQHSLQQ